MSLRASKGSCDYGKALRRQGTKHCGSDAVGKVIVALTLTVLNGSCCSDTDSRQVLLGLDTDSGKGPVLL